MPLSDEAREAIRSGRSNKANKELDLPPRFFGKSLSGFEYDHAVVEKVRNAARSGAGVYIYGPPGVGKTHLAIGLLLDWYADHVEPTQRNQAVFLPSVELFFELKRSFDVPGGDSAVIDRYSDMTMLILDDLGAEKLSEWTRQVFYLLIDRRWRNIRATVVTSNFSLADTARNLDDRIASRLSDGTEIIQLEGPDRRTK